MNYIKLPSGIIEAYSLEDALRQLNYIVLTTDHFEYISN